MTLLERITHFIEAGQSQDDPTEMQEIINRMTTFQLLTEISDALEHAGITFNTRF